MSAAREITPFEDAVPGTAASIASVDTAPSLTPSTAQRDGALKRQMSSLLAKAQNTSKALHGHMSEEAKVLPGEFKELGGQAKSIAKGTARTVAAIPGQTKSAVSATRTAYAQGKAATIEHIENSQLPQSVKRAALNALVKKRETVVVPNLSGQVALVVGGSVGIGLYVAQALALHGAKVIIVGRSQQRCTEAVGEIETSIQEAWNLLHSTDSDVPHPGQVDYAILDLCSLRAIDKFAAEYKESGQKLHLLIHTAGVMLPPHGGTEDGFEMQIGVNHIAVAYLTKQLTDVMVASAPGRVVILSHPAAAHGKMTGIDLMIHNGKYSTTSNYATSRLFNCMYANELRNRLVRSNVDVLVCQPGLTKSDLEAKLDRNKITGRIFKATSKKPQPFDLAALSVIYAATSPQAKGQFGTWYGPDAKNKHNKELRIIPNQLAQDPAWCRRLFDDTFRGIQEAQAAMAAALERVEAAFEGAPVPVSVGASVASSGAPRVKKTGGAKVDEIDPELTAAVAASPLHTLPESALPKASKDEAQDPQQVAKKGGMKGLAGLFGKKKTVSEGVKSDAPVKEDKEGKKDDTAAATETTAAAVKEDTAAAKGKAQVNPVVPNTPSKTKA